MSIENKAGESTIQAYGEAFNTMSGNEKDRLIKALTEKPNPKEPDASVEPEGEQTNPFPELSDDWQKWNDQKNAEGEQTAEGIEMFQEFQKEYLLASKEVILNKVLLESDFETKSRYIKNRLSEKGFEIHAASQLAQYKAKQEWISVKDDLPKEYGRYLICRQKCGKIHFETWNNTGWAYNNNDITHWQPIPEAPAL